MLFPKSLKDWIHLDRGRNEDVRKDLSVLSVHDKIDVYRSERKDHLEIVPNKQFLKKALTYVTFGKHCLTDAVRN